MHPTPIQTKKVIGLFGLAACIYMQSVRCQGAMAIDQSIGEKYSSLLKSAEVFAAKVMPMPSVIPGSALIGAGTLSGVGSCLAVHSTLQVVLGYLLPLAVFFAEETLSRNIYEIFIMRQVKYLQQPNTLFLQHLMLVPFQALVTFQFIICCLNLVETYRNS